MDGMRSCRDSEAQRKRGTKTDARSLRTRAAFVSAFDALARKKSFSELTVSEICQHAGMSRAAFYNHFRDRYDLLAAALDERIRVIEEQLPEPNPYEDIRAILEQIRNDASFARGLMLSKLDWQVLETIQRLFAHSIERTATALGWRSAAENVPLEQAASFSAGGLATLAFLWVRDGCGGDIDQLARQLESLLSGCFKASGADDEPES